MCVARVVNLRHAPARARMLAPHSVSRCVLKHAGIHAALSRVLCRHARSAQIPPPCKPCSLAEGGEHRGFPARAGKFHAGAARACARAQAPWPSGEQDRRGDARERARLLGEVLHPASVLTSSHAHAIAGASCAGAAHPNMIESADGVAHGHSPGAGQVRRCVLARALDGRGLHSACSLHLAH